MRFRRPCKGVLEISPSALHGIDSHRQFDRSAAEAGGLLLGRLIRDSSDVVVDQATVPNLADRRSRFRFFRAAAPAQAAVDAAWRTSGGTRVYLGEWHTHPEDEPKPSCLDRKDWRRIVKRARFEQQALFFAIAGRTWLQVWEVDRGRAVPEKLERIE